MTKQNPATELAEIIIASLLPDISPDWRYRRIANIEVRLQPTFDLLKRIHRLARDAQDSELGLEDRRSRLQTIESLTEEYDDGEFGPYKRKKISGPLEF